MLGFLSKLIGDPNERVLKAFQPKVEEINALADQFSSMDDDELRSLAEEFRGRLEEGESEADILPEAFAAVREVAGRKLNMRHFDVQLIGGMVLHEGKIAEMRTGEGKTLVATLAAYLGALGSGVHVVTVNDYLAKRDASWMGAAYHALGITVGCIQNEGSYVYDPEMFSKENGDKRDEDGRDSVAAFAAVAGDNLVATDKKTAYACDVVYGTNNAFGFDYLRDNMAMSSNNVVQRGLRFAIVDEVDNILIDEARTPLIISGPSDNIDKGKYSKCARLSRQMVKDEDFELDEKRRSIAFTAEGIEKIEKSLGIMNLYSPQNEEFAHLMENAVRAENLYRRDTEYVVRDKEVVLVDEFTGRLMHSRRLSDGMHQAIEAKENVQIRSETRTYATITLQNYFRMYDKLAGMTGTAVTEAEEFHKIYALEVVSIPTNRSDVREDKPDLIYMTEKAKEQAIVTKVAELHKKRSPVLVGTTSIAKSEHLAEELRKRRIKVNVLNARNHENEASIVAQAGSPGAVTVSTNMAGRGTDIILGGNPDMLGIERQQWNKNHEVVLQNGGLFVLGTEKHESRRIDNQLRGRAGRQGDPGHTQFFISAEDEIIRRFGGERIRNVMNTMKWDENDPLESKMMSRTVEASQTKVESYHFEIRKNLVDYDDVINTQRRVIYELRRRALYSEEPRPAVMENVRKEIETSVSIHLAGTREGWDVNALTRDMRQLFPSIAEMATEIEDGTHTPSEVIEQLMECCEALYSKREQEFSPETMRELSKLVLLRTIDQGWVDHLTIMENMRQGIGMEAVGQRDPLVQYKRQAYHMFSDLIENIESRTARTIFNVAPRSQEALSQRTDRRKLTFGSGNAAGSSSSSAPVKTAAKVGRNELCPCGSGRKYKKCHGAI